MACEYTFGGKKMSELEFKKLLLDDAELLAKAKSVAQKRKTIKEIKEENRRHKLEILKSEPITPRQWIQQYFAGGGKISTKDLMRETGFGGKDAKTGKASRMSEFRKRIWMHSKNGTPLDSIIESIQEDWRTNHGGELDYQDVRNEIIDVINSNETPRQMLEDLRNDFTVGGRIVSDKNERIYSIQEEEMAKRYEAQQEMIEGIADKDIETANDLMDDIDGRPLTQEEVESESKAYDEYFKSLSKEEQEKELNSLLYENDYTAYERTKGEENVKDKSIAPAKEQSAKEIALQKIADAKAKAKAVRESKNNLGVADDPFEQAKREAEADREVFDAYVEAAKVYIREGIKTVQDFAKELGEDVSDVIERAWSEANKSDGIKKTFLTKRAYEGELRESVKKELEAKGLTREIESQETALENARKFVDSVGDEAALEAVRNGDVKGGEATAIWGTVLDNVDKKIASAKSEEEARRLNELQGALMDELDTMLLQGGRAASMMNKIYQESDLGYNLQRKIREYKEQNGGEISPEVEAKFREWDEQLKEVKSKLAEAEERAKKAEEQKAISDIKESIEREKKSKRYTARAKQVADEIRKLKSKPIELRDENGNIIDLTTLGVSWNDVVETIAKAVEVGGRIADVINDALKDAEWYGKLTDKGKEAVRKQLEEKIRSLSPIEGGISVPHSLIRELVEGGIENIDELTKVINRKHPNLSEREVRDAITGYGKISNPNREEVEVKIRKMKRIGKAISALDDVRNKKRPLRSGQQRDKLDAEERALNKELREAMKDLPVEDADLEAQLRTQLDAAKQRTQNQIEDLQREIDKGELTPKNARTVKEDAELKALKEKRDALKKEHDAIFKDEEYKQEKRLELTKKATGKRIEDLQRRLREGDFSKKERKSLVADDELTKLKAEKLRIQGEYDKEFYKNKLKNRTTAEKIKDSAWEIWGIPRALMATGEMSFVGVQGLKQSIAHPTHAVEAFRNAWRSFKSEKNTEDFLNRIKSQEWYPTLKQSKLALTEPKAELTAREELFYSGWTNQIWDNLGKLIVSPAKFSSKESYDKAVEKWSSLNPLKAVERASVGYLDTLRVMRFLDGMEMLKEQGKTFENSPQDYKDVADAINTMTGRASLGKAEMIAEPLSKIFFSPRNWASGIKTATPYALYHFGKMTPTARKMAISDFSKFVGLTTSMVMMAAVRLNNDDDPNTSVELDPRSSDFMKIKYGDTRIDPWGGMQQQVVFSSRIMADALSRISPELSKGGYKKDGEILPLGISHKTPTAADLISQQAINKLNPTASIAYNYLNAGRKKDGSYATKYGKEYTLENELSDKFYPIFWGTAADLLKDDPTALDGLLTFYAFFGGGVNTYEKPQSNEQHPNVSGKIKSLVRKR